MFIRELKVSVDTEVKEELKKNFFQNGLMKLVDNELEFKSKAANDFYDICIAGLEAGNLHNSYRNILTSTFGDKVSSKEPEMIKNLSQYTGISLPVLYSAIQQWFMKIYGEFAV